MRLRRSVGSLGTPQPAFANVVLLLHCDGTNGSTTFTDSAGTPNTMTASGNAAITTSQSKFGGASGDFDGTGDYVKPTSATNFGIFDGAYTIEAWARITNLPASGTVRSIFSASQNSGGGFRYLNFGVLGSGALRFSLVGTSSLTVTSAVSLIAINTWYHVAFVRSGVNGYLFIDGSLVQASSSLIDYADADVQQVAMGSIGNQYTDANFVMWQGQIDDLRVSREAVYTTGFDAPTVAHPDS